MKARLLLIALVAAVIAGAAMSSDSNAKVRMKWVDLLWRSTLTSSTTPTYASKYGGANSGNRYVDSLTVTRQSAGNMDSGKLADTTAAFSLFDLVPDFSQPDSLTAFADTNIAITLVVYNDPNSAITPEMTAVNYFVLQGSMNGTDWVAATAIGDSLRFAETVSGNDVFVATLRSDNVAQATNSSQRWWGFKLYRLILTNDIVGTFKAKLGYLANVP